MSNLVLIPSIIKTPNSPLSYTNTRSVYSHQERYEQTKKTIQSVRDKIPNVKIFIVECSDLDHEQTTFFKTTSDYFINLYDNISLKNNIHSISKSLGEGTMTYYALEYILTNNIEFDNLFKITGRYSISDNFNYEHYNNNDIVIKYIEGNKDNVFTSLYKLPKQAIVHFKDFLQNNFNEMIKCIGYEVLFAMFLKSFDVKNIEILGVSGNISVCGEYFTV